MERGSNGQDWEESSKELGLSGLALEEMLTSKMGAVKEAHALLSVCTVLVQSPARDGGGRAAQG
jgi:hypothetical protein